MEIGPPVPEKKIFERFFSIYGRGGHLGHVTTMPRTNFVPNLALIGQAVSEKKMFEHCGRRTDDGRRRTDAGQWVSYKLTYEPLAQVS